MKKIIGFMMVAAFIMPTAFALADATQIASVDCPTDNNHPVYDVSGTVITSCIPNSTWDANMAAGQIQQNEVVLPSIAPGASVTDDHGITYTCSTSWSCVDTVHVDSYRSAMQAIAKELEGLTLSTTRFDGWIHAVAGN